MVEISYLALGAVIEVRIVQLLLNLIFMTNFKPFYKMWFLIKVLFSHSLGFIHHRSDTSAGLLFVETLTSDTNYTTNQTIFFEYIAEEPISFIEFFTNYVRIYLKENIIIKFTRSDSILCFNFNHHAWTTNPILFGFNLKGVNSKIAIFYVIQIASIL